MIATIVGHLGRDAERRKDDKTGREYVYYSIADNSSRKYNKDAPTVWVTCFSSYVSENLLPLLKRGTQVQVVGALNVGVYVNKEGLAVPDLRLTVWNLELCGSNNTQQKQSSPYGTQQQVYVGAGGNPQASAQPQYGNTQQQQPAYAPPTYPQQGQTYPHAPQQQPQQTEPAPIGGGDDLPF